MYYTSGEKVNPIPNPEVRNTYTRIIQRYFSSKIENKYLEIRHKALVEGDRK